MVWEKPHAIWRNQGSRHTRILGNTFKTQFVGAIWSSPNRKACNFTRLGHMQSFSTTHCLQLALTQDELFQKVRLTPRVPRVVRKWNSQYGPQDPQSQEARSSWDPSSASKSYGEICSNTVNHRISGVPLSAVEPRNTIRENKVKRLIEKFENHKHKESVFQDLSQTQKINKFSKESQDLIADLNNIEIFELCENSYKQQCPDCNAYWESGIICCSCGRNMKSTRSLTEFDQNNRDDTSIPGHVIKKNSSRGVKHGPSERQKMYYQAKQMLKKASQGKHGRHPTILSRWYADEEYRNPLSAAGWKEYHIMLYDRIAVEKHICVATRAERIQNSKHWILTTNAEGRTQQSLNQRPDFAQAKRECKRLHDEHLARTQEEYRTIPRNQHETALRTTIRGHRRTWLRVDPKTGWSFYKGSRINLQTTSSGSQANLQTASSSSSTWDQTHWKTSNWNSEHSSSPDDWWFFLRVWTVSVAWRKTSSQPTGRVNSTPTNTARTELHSMITFHHVNTRGSRAAKLRIAHLRVPKTSVIHVSCLVLCRTWFQSPAQDLSHPFHPLLLSFRRSHFCTQAPYDSRPLQTLRCSTAEWRINTNPISRSFLPFPFVRLMFSVPLDVDKTALGWIGIITLFAVGLVIPIWQLTCAWVKQNGRRVKLMWWLAVGWLSLGLFVVYGLSCISLLAASFLFFCWILLTYTLFGMPEVHLKDNWRKSLSWY